MSASSPLAEPTHGCIRCSQQEFARFLRGKPRGWAWPEAAGWPTPSEDDMLAGLAVGALDTALSVPLTKPPPPGTARPSMDELSQHLQVQAQALLQALRAYTDDADCALTLARDIFAAQQQVLLVGAAMGVGASPRLERNTLAPHEPTEFVSTLSHELRTPLTSVLGYAEFLEDEMLGPLTSEQAGFVKLIQAGGQRLLRIVEDLLDVASVEAGTFTLVPQEADFVAVVAEAVDSLQIQARQAGVHVGLRVEAVAREARFDPIRVGQVVINLVGNAIKFTPEGGHVEIAIEQAGQALVCSVHDTGPGLSVAQQARVFQKFYQVRSGPKRTAGGTGLGLAIAKALVEAHGGEIGVRSVPREGSTFWFTLPVA